MKVNGVKMKRLIFCFFLLWAPLAITGFGQPGDPGTDPDVPISGIEILIALGGLFGAGKFLASKRNQKG